MQVHDGASRFNSSPHAHNHCVFTMYPVWTPEKPKSLPYSHSVKPTLSKTTWMHQVPVQSTLNSDDHEVLCPHSRICGQLQGFLLILHLASKDLCLQTTVGARYTEWSSTCTNKEGSDGSQPHSGPVWGFKVLCCIFKISLFYSQVAPK